MTKEEIKRKFFDVIGTKLSYSAKTDEIKDLSKAFKNVCDTEYDDSLLTELSKIPTDKQGQAKTRMNSCSNVMTKRCCPIYSCTFCLFGKIKLLY